MAKGIIVVIILLILAVAATAIVYGVNNGWFKNSSLPQASNESEVVIKGQNSSGDYKVMYFNIIEVNSRSTILTSKTDESHWTSIHLPPESKKVNYIIDYWNNDSFRTSKDIYVSEFLPNQITLDENKVCEPSMKVLNTLNDVDKDQIISLEIGCQDGKLMTPMLCTSWSQGIIAARRSPEWQCPTAYYINKKPVFWKNFTYFNETSKAMLPTDFNNYACSDNAEVVCKELINQTCTLDNAPLQGMKYPVMECLPMPTINVGENRTVDFNVRIIEGRLFKNIDKIGFYILTPECSNSMLIDGNPTCVYRYNPKGKIFNTTLEFQ